MTTTTKTPTTDTLLADLRRRRAERQDVSDLPVTMPDRQIREYVALTSKYDVTISGLVSLPNDLQRQRDSLADCEARRAAVFAKWAEIEQAVSDAPDLESIADRREHETEEQRQNHLHQTWQLLRQGRLLYAPGQAYERIGDIDARIAELQKRIAGLQSTLDFHLATAAALLGETVTTS